MATLIQSAVCRLPKGSVSRPFPTLFYIPGLNSKPWHNGNRSNNDADDGLLFSFPWVSKLEANYEAIKEEYVNLVRGRSEQQQRAPPSSSAAAAASSSALPLQEESREGAESDYKPSPTEHQLHSGRWDWHSYVLKGKKQDKFKVSCPVTAALLDDIHDHSTDVPFAYSFFSTLHGGASIKEHTGPCNIRLRCHFPLIVPSQDPKVCGITVGGETRAWVPGKAMIFDDCYPHEVHNHAAGERVVLLFDTWHPSLSKEERQSIVDMFQLARSKGWIKDEDQ